MTNFEQYVEDEAQEYGYSEPVKDFILAGYAKLDWKSGFKACIDLNLPVKFAIWKDKNVRATQNGKTYNLWYGTKKYKYTELYQYWLNNIYKP
jgi:hypothetical protein